jgi:arsenate reductase
LDKIEHIDFDLVVTVCDHANENCPIFSKPIPTIHVGFKDPDGQEYKAFEETYKEIKEKLLPILTKKLKVV